MNNTLFDELKKFKSMMFLEQSENDLYYDKFNSADFRDLKEFLMKNDDLVNVLHQIFNTKTIDTLHSSLSKPNKTLVMKGMNDSKMKKDTETYKFLDIILKNSDTLK